MVAVLTMIVINALYPTLTRSGSMANLEMAIQLAKSNLKPVNQVLFAFWGAEELGLLGSRHFVQKLTEDGTIYDIILNLNYDMIVSDFCH